MSLLLWQKLLRVKELRPLSRAKAKCIPVKPLLRCCEGCRARQLQPSHRASTLRGGLKTLSPVPCVQAPPTGFPLARE